MQRLRVRELVIVEGRYDAVVLAGIMDGLILTTDGFSIFSDEEKKALIRRLGKERGIIILTDSDAAGFQIRHYIEKIATGCEIKNAYIPAVTGKESRKAKASSEGFLGVEGLAPPLLLAALERAGVSTAKPSAGRAVTYTDLFEKGLSGQPDSAERRRRLLHRIGLPHRLSKRTLCQVLTSLYTYEEFCSLLEDKPVLFWDFHGTLTLPDVVWFDAAMEAAQERVPEHPLDREVLEKYFGGTCLPWFSVPDRDTRHLVAQGAWWAHCEEEFRRMFENCGFTTGQAYRIAPLIRKKILQGARYSLYPEAVQTLRELQKRGYISYILSNNFPELDKIVEYLGLRPYLAGVLVSGQMGYEKPRREIFAMALEKAGSPPRAWMIGDNPVDDIEGGNNAGLTTVTVHNVPAPHADYSINSLDEILTLLP